MIRVVTAISIKIILLYNYTTEYGHSNGIRRDVQTSRTELQGDLYNVFLYVYLSRINAKHGDNTEEARVDQLLKDLVVAHNVPHCPGDVLAAGACLLPDHHLDDVFVLVHVELLDLATDGVGDDFGPLASCLPVVGFVWKEQGYLGLRIWDIQDIPAQLTGQYTLHHIYHYLPNFRHFERFFERYLGSIHYGSAVGLCKQSVVMEMKSM